MKVKITVEIAVTSPERFEEPRFGPCQKTRQP